MNKTCKLCTQPYEVTEDDLKFIEKVSPVIGEKKLLIPPPTLCPTCRARRRMAFRNERNLSHRKCDLCEKPMITIYSPDKDVTVYCSSCWWSDNWDPLKYGRDYDFTKSFTEQFAELQKVVPRLGMLFYNNENSEYTNYVSNLKNCYLLFSADFNQDCMYGTWYENSNSCVDNYNIDHCELSYEAFFSNKLYNCKYVIASSGCRDSAFLFDCRGSSDCYMSYGLRNKQYYIANKAYSKEEYESIMQKIDLGSYETLKNEKEKFLNYIKDCPRLYLYRNGSIENSTGNFLTDTSNCTECYEVLRGKDCKYVHAAFDINNTMDSCYISDSWGYENCECVPTPQNSSFNLNSYTGVDLYYTDTCMNDCKSLFGCIGMKHKKYCILNKQYAEEEYEELVPKIIEHMKSTGEWGEFFAHQLSLFGYNETVANEYAPLTKEEALKINAGWKDEEAPSQKEVAKVELADNVNQVTEDILNEVLTCQSCSKNYKIINKELEFYKKMEIPIPRNCPDCRHAERLKFRNPRHLYDRKCAKCTAPILTTYAPDRPETVYCEKCYLETVY